VMNPGDTSGWNADDRLAFVLDREDWFQAWTLVIYVLFGAALVAVTVALHERLKAASNTLAMIATPFGFIWAGLVIASGMIASVGLSAVAGRFEAEPLLASQLWTTVGVIQNGLGGGVEVVGGFWVLMISLASWATPRSLPLWLNCVGLVVGVTGVLTVVPAWKALGAVFGLTQIVWFIGVGMTLLRAKSS
ncbi:MAG: hypothetical protein AAFN07_16025, partial [Pseudomonadota bacterium]